jgi:NAD(P) transhydrogenase subunit beta
VLSADRLRAGRADHHPDRRGRHAGGGVDAQQLLGWAGAGIGFSLNNPMLIIAGSLVGSSGRDPELHHVQGDEPLVLQRHPRRLRRRSHAAAAAQAQRNVKSGSATTPAFVLGNAEPSSSCPATVWPWRRAQHAVKELAAKLTAKGITVKYAIHPVAGRMPGHMNVLLAEAEVPYDQVFEMEDINGEFGQADVAIILAPTTS